MNPNLELRESNNWWDEEMDYSKYGFSVFSVCKNGRKTGYKAIVNNKSDKIVHIASEKYKLLPNEVVLEAANEIAEQVGLVPFKTVIESANDWKTWKSRAQNASKTYTKRKFAKAGRVLVQEFNGNQHVLADSDATSIFAFYTMPDIVEMDKNEQFHFGLAVRNSIDGTSHLAIDGFSFRHICQNMSIATIQSIAKANQIAGSMRRRHTINMDVSFPDLKERMELVVGKLKNLQNVYGRWMTEELNSEVATRLGRSISPTYLPDYIQVEKKKVTVTADPMPTLWKTYNQITAEIWHRPVEMHTKQILFEKLHTAYGL